MEFRRYAIFYTPPPGPFADFGAAWLGWDIGTGRAAPPRALPALPRPLEEITESPSRYGFHGTLKPPFRLAPGQTEAALLRSFAALCAATRAARLDGLELARLGRFLALVPIGDSAAVAALAARALRAFEPFRAPLNAAELARRRARGLSARQEELLCDWGYPFVLDQFRFHMTLTSRLPRAEAKAVEAALLPQLGPILPAPLCLDALTLVGERPDGRFQQIARRALTGL